MKPECNPIDSMRDGPAAFGRLCVETLILLNFTNKKAPAAFGRLCVETPVSAKIFNVRSTSRLRAAVC